MKFSTAVLVYFAACSGLTSVSDLMTTSLVKAVNEINPQRIAALGESPSYDNVIQAIAKSIQEDSHPTLDFAWYDMVPKEARDDIQFLMIGHGFKSIINKFQKANLNEKHMTLLLHALWIEQRNNAEAFNKIEVSSNEIEFMNSIWDLVKKSSEKFQRHVWDWLPSQVLGKAKNHTSLLMDRLVLKNSESGRLNSLSSVYSLVESEYTRLDNYPSYHNYNRVLKAQNALLELYQKLNERTLTESSLELWKTALFADDWKDLETNFADELKRLSNIVTIGAAELNDKAEKDVNVAKAVGKKAKINSEYYTKLFNEWKELVKGVEYLGYGEENYFKKQDFLPKVEPTKTKVTSSPSPITATNKSSPLSNPPPPQTSATGYKELIRMHLGDKFVDIFESQSHADISDFALKFTKLNPDVQKKIWDELPHEDIFNDVMTLVLARQKSQPNISKVLEQQLEKLADGVDIIDLVYWQEARASLMKLDSAENVSNAERVQIYKGLLSGGKGWDDFINELKLKIPPPGKARSLLGLNFEWLWLQKSVKKLEEMAKDNKATKEDIDKKADDVAKLVLSIYGVEFEKTNIVKDAKIDNASMNYETKIGKDGVNEETERESKSAGQPSNVSNKTNKVSENNNNLVIGGFIVLSAAAVGVALAYFNGYFGHQGESEGIAIAES